MDEVSREEDARVVKAKGDVGGSREGGTGPRLLVIRYKHVCEERSQRAGVVSDGRGRRRGASVGTQRRGSRIAKGRYATRDERSAA